MEKYKEIEKSIITTYRKDIWHLFMKAITDYKLISENDKIAVCISGGKDSFLMAKCFDELSRHSDIPFELVYLVMNPGYSKENLDLIISNAKILNLNIQIFDANIFNYTKTLKDKACYMCAKMRRGALYSKAKELGCNKISLGHHYSDVTETIILNMLYAGEIKTMLPKLRSTNYEGMELIRPLYLVKEESIIEWAKTNELKFLNCACKYTTKDIDSKRKKAREIINHLNEINPLFEVNIFTSLSNINLDKIMGLRSDEDGRLDFNDLYDNKKSK